MSIQPRPATHADTETMGSPRGDTTEKVLGGPEYDLAGYTFGQAVPFPTSEALPRSPKGAADSNSEEKPYHSLTKSTSIAGRSQHLSRPSDLSDTMFENSQYSPVQFVKGSVDSLAYPIYLQSEAPSSSKLGETMGNMSPRLEFGNMTSPYKRQRQATDKSESSSYPMLPVAMSPIQASPASATMVRWPTRDSPSKGHHGSSGASTRSRRSSKVSAGYPNFMPNMGGIVRSLSRDVLSDVTLRDVLDGRTCSPIGFRDFEGFVSHKEYTAENLLFIVWYRSYCSRFSELPEEEKAKVAIPSTKLQDSSNPFGYLTKKEEGGKVAATFAQGIRRASVWGRRGSVMGSALLGAKRAGEKGEDGSPDLSALQTEKLGGVTEEETGSPPRGRAQQVAVTVTGTSPLLEEKVPSTFTSTEAANGANGTVDIFAATPKITGHQPYKVCSWSTEGEVVCVCSDPSHSHKAAHVRGQRLGRGLDVAEEHLGNVVRIVKERSASGSRAGSARNSEESLRERYLGKGRRASAAPSELSAKSITEEDGGDRQMPSKAYMGRRRSSLPMLVNSSLSSVSPDPLGAETPPASAPVSTQRMNPSGVKPQPPRLDRIQSVSTPMEEHPVSPFASANYVFGQTPSSANVATQNPILSGNARPPVTFQLNELPTDQGRSDYVPGVRPEDQPMRLEAQRVYATFLRMGGLRELNVSEEMRNNTKEALRGSTHPDVFLPIFKEIYGLVETQSLPHFLSYSQTNVNLPKQAFWYLVGITDLAISVLMFLLMVFLLPSHPFRIRAWRIFSVVFATFGAMQTYSAWRGFCTQVWGRASRQMHPWEMDQAEDEVDAEAGGAGTNFSVSADVRPDARGGMGSAYTSSTKVGTESFGSTEKALSSHEDLPCPTGIIAPGFAERLSTAASLATDSKCPDSWQPDSAWGTALPLDSADLADNRVIAPFSIIPDGQPLVPGSGKPLDAAQAKLQEKHVFRTLLSHLRRDPVSVKHRKPAIFGPEIIILDERVLRLHKRIIRDILVVGAMWGTCWFAICLAVPGYRS